MSESQDEVFPASPRQKHWKLGVCVSSIILLSVALAATLSTLGAKSGENTNTSASSAIRGSSILSSKNDIGANASQPVATLTDEGIPKRRPQELLANPTAPFQAAPSKPSTNNPTTLTPTSYPTPLEDLTAIFEVEDCSKSVDGIVESNNLSNNETSVFEGPVSDFIVLQTQDLARIASKNKECSSKDGLWRFQLDTDNYGFEISWELVTGDAGKILAGGPPANKNYKRKTRYLGLMCLKAGEYTLRVKDKGGDGLCCDFGQGAFSASVDGNTVINSDDDDFTVKEYSFDVHTSTTSNPSPRPSPKPTTKPTWTPLLKPTPSESCFTEDTYDAIDSDIAKIKSSISNSRNRRHFLGGIVRLVAHDFMDYSRHSSRNPMGPDGCFDASHPINAGLEDIWCPTCELTQLYEQQYSHISRADFWIASANAVIRQTSVNNALDLRNTFLWGRQDANECHGSGDRLPLASGCDQSEAVFIDRMGLEWRDVVALMGAHTLGGAASSGHRGSWVKDDQTEVFDNKYYDELVNSVWWPTKMSDPTQDWVTGRSSSLMLNTDMCLAFDIEDAINDEVPCCTKTNRKCLDPDSRKTKCPVASRLESLEAVEEMLGMSNPHDVNMPFYESFAEAWRKATTVGKDNLSPLVQRCDSIFV